MSTVAGTEDLGYSLSASDRAIAPGAIHGWSNLYLRNNATGVTTLVFKTPGIQLFDQATGLSGGLFLGASADWSHILIRSNTPLTPDSDPNTAENLYDLSGGEAHLLNYHPDGTVERPIPKNPLHVLNFTGRMPLRNVRRWSPGLPPVRVQRRRRCRRSAKTTNARCRSRSTRKPGNSNRESSSSPTAPGRRSTSRPSTP